MSLAARVSRILMRVIAALVCLCSMLMLTFLFLRSQSPMYLNGQQMALPTGYELSGGYLEAAPAPCHVIRVTSDTCPYCRQDQEYFARLATSARQMGCRVIELAPRLGQIAERPEAPAVQLQYVDMTFGRSLHPFLTPQTLVLDGGGRLRWQRQGAMDSSDAEIAVQAASRPSKAR